MVSRLDRLFILLDTGSSESIRLAAAKQIGEVQQAQPNDLNYLLSKIKELAYKSCWETRIAAGHATRCVLEQVELWPPERSNDANVLDPDSKHSTRHEIAKTIIKKNVNIKSILQNFDIESVMESTDKLASSNMTSFTDVDSKTTGFSQTTSSCKQVKGRKLVKKAISQQNESFSKQRKLINKELGIDMVDRLNLGVKSTDIVSNDDLQTNLESDTSQESFLKLNQGEKSPQQLLTSTICNYKKIINLLSESACLTTPKLADLAVPEQKSNRTEISISKPSHEWPLEGISQAYLRDLFNPSWEVRHGAAIALREIIKIHGKSAGKINCVCEDVNNTLNQLWLVDLALSAICVLALDKFGDFLFDQVVAPVRENAAQLLSCCFLHLDETNINETLSLTLKLLQHPAWETRHGGTLALKYSLNVVSESLTKEILQRHESIFDCLNDPVDDVSAEAAAALVSISDLMLLKAIPDKIPKLINFLWGHLEILDELNSSTSNIVLLLTSLLTSANTSLEPNDLSRYIPILWSKLNHPSTNVRKSVLKAIQTLIQPRPKRCSSWMSEQLLSTCLRLTYQRAIIENMDEVHPYLEQIWMNLIKIEHGDNELELEEKIVLLKTSSQYLNYWLCLIMHPNSTPIDLSNPMWCKMEPQDSTCGDFFIASCTFNAEAQAEQRHKITKCRLLCSKLLGSLYAVLSNKSTECRHSLETLMYLSEMFVHYIKTTSANQKIVSCWALESWANHQLQLLNNDTKILQSILPQHLKDQLNIAVKETSLYYDELVTSFTRLQQNARDFVQFLSSSNINLDCIEFPKAKPGEKRHLFTLNQIQAMCQIDLESELSRILTKKSNSTPRSKKSEIHDVSNSKLYEQVLEKQIFMSKSFKEAQESQKNLSTSVLGSLASAGVAWYLLPNEKELFVKPLIESIETEEDYCLQEKYSNYLVKLTSLLCADYSSNESPIGFIVDRLTKEICRDSSQVIECDDAEDPAYKILLLDTINKRSREPKILQRRKIAAEQSLKRSYVNGCSRVGDSSSNLKELSEPESQSLDIKSRGLIMTLRQLVSFFGSELPEKLPVLWKLLDISTDQDDDDLMISLKTLEIVWSSLDKSLKLQLENIVHQAMKMLSSERPITRYLSCQLIGIMSKTMNPSLLDKVFDRMLPILENFDAPSCRCGAIECLGAIIENLQLEIVQYSHRLITPILRRMSDQIGQIRLMAAHCFGRLLSLLPLGNSNSKEYEGYSAGQSETSGFINDLLNPKRLEDYKLPFEINAQLRSYQQEGINWLAFLNKFNLHGILCDEMGLGKTIMTICIVAAHYYYEKNADAVILPKPSLVVCPSTLTNHWLNEIEKFMSNGEQLLRPISYAGCANDRVALRDKIHASFEGVDDINIVVTSYETVRGDVKFFDQFQWSYCVLDEGHMIKNGKTKLSKAIKMISAKHRLILSGTPIQNNVTELWSLFDFLMPGFLGTENQFNSRYTKPILQSRVPKCSAKEKEQGIFAMESLHSQVLPFILRRLKKDVLKDLPSKIIQDYQCELSPSQLRLYEDFTKSQYCNQVSKKSLSELEETKDSEALSSSKSHIFTALKYLRNICSHPKLVLNPKHSDYKKLKGLFESSPDGIDDINHSSKLKSLKQLLLDCGIGLAEDASQQTVSNQLAVLSTESIVNQHRALIFCQLKSMLDIIEKDLFKKHLPSVTYLRLDGSIPIAQRQSIVNRFNDDPSIDVLLLTTQIGGLGLNLIGADTVIFVEHDWNPTRDMQAMDRAHRIGQKRVVNVYRLITKDTVEEKIMSLQKFKTMVSETVITKDNFGLASMQVDRLFDLFDKTQTVDYKALEGSSDKASQAKSKSNFLDLLPELWSEQDYETEYDLSSFITSLKRAEK